MIEGTINVPGGKIYYRQYGNLNSNPPLFAVHGGPGFCHDTFEALSPLAEDRAVILYDQLGCGQSDRPDDKKLWTLERYVDELQAVIDHFNPKKYHLLGHSFGGTLAMEHALSKPEKLKSLILSSPLISVTDWLCDAQARKSELPAEIQRQLNQHEADGTTDSDEYQSATKAFYQNFLCRLDPAPDIYVESLKKFNLDIYHAMWGPSEFHCTGNLADYERADRLSELTIPILLLCGHYDEARPSTLKRYLKQLANGSLHIFENSSHNAYLEQTKEYIKVVREFLDQTSENRRAIKTGYFIPDNERWLHTGGHMKTLERALEWAAKNKPQDNFDELIKDFENK